MPITAGTLIAAGAGVWALSKFKKGKAAYNMGFALEGVRLVKFSTGYAVIGVKIRLTNKDDATVNLKSYSTKVTFQNTIIATGSQSLDYSIPGHSEQVIELQINTGNYSSTLLQTILDLFNSSYNNEVTVDYCIEIAGFPQYCDTEKFQL